MTLHSLKN